MVWEGKMEYNDAEGTKTIVIRDGLAVFYIFIWCNSHINHKFCSV